MNSKIVSCVNYNNSQFQTIQENLEAEIASIENISEGKLQRLFVKYTQAQYPLTFPVDMSNVSPETLVNTVLKPRQDLYRLILTNWIRYVFIPALGPHISRNILIFGVGRIFSDYSDMGVQYCTDADLNIVAKDTLETKSMAILDVATKKLKEKMQKHFNIIVEVDDAFTILKVKDIKTKLHSTDNNAKTVAKLFYKANADSLFVIHDNPALRRAIFTPVKRLSDTLLFENFLGNNPVKPTYMRLRKNQVKLSIIADQTHKKRLISDLIGSPEFERKCRYLFDINQGLFPQDWYHSLKYNVNRVYDYVSAMLAKGYALTDIGFNSSNDPDYKFLCDYHKWMLYFQEIIHIKYDTYNNMLSDYSYISAERFEYFMSLPKNGFRDDFERMVLDGNFLGKDEKYQYVKLIGLIENHRSVALRITNEEATKLEDYGFTDIDYSDCISWDSKLKVFIPYRYRDLGFLVFDYTHNRLSRIVNKKLYPALDKLEG